MNNTKYTLKIHSFVDLITNSSTEIYIGANERTITTIKELINNILKIGGSTLTSDDLFELSLTEGTECTAVTIQSICKIDSPEGNTASQIISSLTNVFECQEIMH